MTSNRYWRKLFRFLHSEGITAILFLAPSLIGFLIFYLIPFAMGVQYSFQDRTVDGSFVGLTNYKALIESDSFRKAASNTLLFTSVGAPLIIMLSLLCAHVLNQKLFIRDWLQTAFVLPLVVPVASVVMVWQILFDWNGTLNVLLDRLQLERIDWMNSDWSMVVLIIVYIWKNMGYNVILFLAGLQTIPKDYYETAGIEGAGNWYKWFHITLVYLTPTIILVVLMSIINCFKVFREAYLIAGAYPHDRVYMLQHYMNNMFLSLDIQKLTAASVVMVGCIFCFVMVMFAIEKRYRNFME